MVERLIKKGWLLIAFIPNLAFAASIIDNPNAAYSTPKDVENLIGRIRGIATSIAGALAFIVIAAGAILYATAGGDPEKAKRAKTILYYGLGGAIIITLANVIVFAFAVLLAGGP